MTRILAPRSAGAVVKSVRHRLSDVELAERDMLEDQLLTMLIGQNGLALHLGWETMHVRPAMRRTRRKHWTPTTGTLGKGWVDLVLVRDRDRRLIFAELKKELEQPTEDQERVLGILRSLAGGPQPTPFPGTWTRVEVHVWRPSDAREPMETSRIYEVLR